MKKKLVISMAFNSGCSIFKVVASFISLTQSAIAADFFSNAPEQSATQDPEYYTCQEICPQDCTCPCQADRSPQKLDYSCEPPICPQVCGCPCPVDESECLRLYTYFLVDGGYRFDRITNETGIQFPNNFEMFDYSTIAKNLQVFEVGGKGLIAFDSHWYARGFYYYGWIVDGDFSEPSLKGKQNGNTQDGLGGFGYLAPINQTCSLGFLGGWAFDEQETILREASLNPFNGLKFTSIWNGPWLGLDFYARNRNGFLFNLGYEFHGANWRGSWLLEHHSSLAYSDQRRGGIAFGHVVYADFLWFINCHFLIDLEVKYQNWSLQSVGIVNSSGSVPFSSSPVCGPVCATTFVKEATWESIGVSLNLGYSF